MRITTTNKIKGALELTSLGTQLTFNHSKNKPQVITVDNKHRMNMDVQAAADLKLIVLSDYDPKPKEQNEDVFLGEESVIVPTVILQNLTKNPMVFSVGDQKVELPANGKARFPATILESPHVIESIDKKIKVIDEDGVLNKQDEVAYDIAEDEVQEEQKIQEPKEATAVQNVTEEEVPAVQSVTMEEAKMDTTAVVANPNNEKLYKTSQSVKKINAKKIKPAKESKPDSSIKVYSPEEPTEEKEETIPFVDKEQEAERIKERQEKASSDAQNLSDTKVVQTEKLEGTTPVVVKRTPKKSAAKSPAKTAKAKKPAKKADQTEIISPEAAKDIFNLE